MIEIRCARLEFAEFKQRRADDQRQHQQRVDIERESDRGHYADHPLHGGDVRSCLSCFGGVGHR